MLLELTDQATKTGNIQPKIAQLKGQMNLRIPIWAKLSNEKRKAWVQSDKDPIMTLAYNTYVYLKDNFFGDYE